MTDSLDDVVVRLRAAGCVFAEDEAALLLGEGLDDAALERALVRRCLGEPLEVVLGWASFAGVRVVVAPGVFVPRSRTALVVDVAVESVAGRADPAVLDLCCGTGAVAAAVLARRPDAQVHAADLDPAAVACARRNLPPDRVHEGDLFAALPDALRGHFDVIAANAPYVPTAAIATMPPEARVHEPAVALDGGADGLDLHRRIARGASPWLVPGGVLLVETSREQAASTVALLADAGFATSVRRDDDVDGTVVVGRR
ncbi:putative protein N(5)-glutamine methyltransferase [Cellulomonas composti]|uniref:peptide chain release factor N(5)-glutamine methyltransferase n=1 Tax=Cellulomonas composti TaxID=266130 RepID=A0A511J684_9CELL|nr:putative protein N(5)-glutamine methyltransferase [Cellulomonas composti]GEL93498.1 N5-glutamine S-adenosyl-L-methionine-dependent methyltransferase [Cellulomonas composti]